MTKCLYVQPSEVSVARKWPEALFRTTRSSEHTSSAPANLTGEKEVEFPAPLVATEFLTDLNLLRAGAKIPVSEVFTKWPQVFEFEASDDAKTISASNFSVMSPFRSGMQMVFDQLKVRAGEKNIVLICHPLFNLA